jgi:uncharacterized protein (DUF2147 family)
MAGRIEHDPEKWAPVFRKRSCSNKKIERDGDSTKSYLALGFVLLMLSALLGAPTAQAQAGGGEVTGIWLTQAGDARVRVSKCGGGICGVIVGLREPIDPATGKPAVDDKNPNPTLARRPMIGLPLFTGMRPVGPNKWSGQIYNADDGQSYASSISLAGPQSLRVEGCVGALCGGETWTRSGR